VPPLLSTRAERLAKRLLRAARGRHGGSESRRPFDLDRIYALTMAGSLQAAALAVDDAFRCAVEPEQAIDITFAALALALARRDNPRIAGLAGFLELCYEPAELEAGTERMAGYIRAAREGSELASLDCTSFARLADGARAQAAHEPEVHRSRWLRPWPGPKRVVVRVSGGLGNQLFQYAAALGYARRIGAPLHLDLVEYESPESHRRFELGRLRVPVRRTNSLEVALARLRPHRETQGVFDQFMFENHGTAWLRGFWEDDVYFADILPTIRRRFQPRDEALATAARETVERARAGGAPVVGVHMRRGDRGPGGNAFAPLSSLPASYYRQAASRFPGNVHFLVFSDTPDDVDWCRNHLGLGETAPMSFGAGTDPILDMFALAACDHVILSSGTFSWWAGYLGDRPGRSVIVPNPLQGLSVERAREPVTCPPQPSWEAITLTPHDLR